MKNLLFIVLAILAVVILYFFSNDHREVIKENQVGSLNLENIPVAVVNNFDLYREQRLLLLQEIAGKVHPKLLLVIVADHTAVGADPIITSDGKWQPTADSVPVAEELMGKIISDGLAVRNEPASDIQLKMNNLFYDVRQTFPLAQTLPIIIQDAASKDDINRLSNWIINNLNDYLVIVSVGLSCCQSNALDLVHNYYALQAVADFDLEKIWLAEIQDRQTLYLATKVAGDSGGDKFHLYSESVINPDNFQSQDCHRGILAYFSDQQPSAAEIVEPTTSFVIAGDVMFDRAVWHYYKDRGLESIFSQIGDRVFRGVDLSLVNLEGPIAANEIDDDWLTDSLVFNFPPQTISALKYLNINSVSLANNHTNNAGSSGLENTRRVLSQSQINYFGRPSGFAEDSVLRVNGGVPISVIGIMAIDNFDNQPVLTQISAEKSAGRKVLVFSHWGVEYASNHSLFQRQLAQSWISAGADLVIGSHPHVTQDFEIVDGKPVIYSLGNFVFDQFFSQETQEGLIIAGVLKRNSLILSFLPTRSKLSQPKLLTAEEKAAKIKTFFDINSEIGFKKLTNDTIEIAF